MACNYWLLGLWAGNRAKIGVSGYEIGLIFEIEEVAVAFVMLSRITFNKAGIKSIELI